MEYNDQLYDCYLKKRRESLNNEQKGNESDYDGNWNEMFVKDKLDKNKVQISTINEKVNINNAAPPATNKFKENTTANDLKNETEANIDNEIHDRVDNSPEKMKNEAGILEENENRTSALERKISEGTIF